MSKNLKVEHNVQADLEELIKKLDNPNTEKTVKEFYDTVAKFNNFSFHNCWLLNNQAKQRGVNLSYVTSLKDFNELGATVQKGAKSLKVFAPKQNYEIQRDSEGKTIKDRNNRYKYILDEKGEKIPTSISFIQVPVFDISQTNAKEKGLVPKLNYRNNSNSISKEMLEDLYKEVQDKFQVKVEEKNINDDDLGGYYQKDKKQITINSNPSKTPSSKLGTLFHELAHHLLHGHDNYRAIHLDKGQKEGERESVRYIVSKAFNITQDSQLYLKSWDRDSENLQNHLKYISDTAKRIIKTIDLKMILEKELKEDSLKKSYLNSLIENSSNEVRISKDQGVTFYP